MPPHPIVFAGFGGPPGNGALVVAIVTTALYIQLRRHFDK